MADICDGTSATGEGAFHPGESILAAGESFQELDDGRGSNSGDDDQEVDCPSPETFDDDKSAASDEGVSPSSFFLLPCCHAPNQVYLLIFDLIGCR